MEGGLLLLDRASNCLFAYNDTSRHVWDLIEAGRTEEQLECEFAEVWGIPLALARADIRSIVAQWRLQNILVGGRGKRRPAPVTPRSSVIDDRHRASTPNWTSEWVCTIRGTTIAFAAESELPGPIRLLFAHLETPDAEPQVRIEVRDGPSGERVLVENGRERMRTNDPAEAVGALFVAVLERTRENLQWFALIHGAALGRDRQGLALVGPSGSGKSTLAAGLVSKGYDFLADDLVALSEPNGTIVPWPLPLSVKQGSFAVLSAQHPQLTHAPSYRTKGVDARMLEPPTRAWDAEPVPLRNLVFPRFVDGAAPELRRMSSFEAIERLLSDRIWLGNPITEQRISVFLEWLDRTPAHALSYGSLDDGVRLIADVVA